MARSKSEAKRQAALAETGPRMLGGEERTVPIDSIAPHPENARDGDVPAIKRSIQASGFYGRLVVWHGSVIVGSHRWEALRQLGAEEVPVLVVDHLDERTARRLMAADNRVSDLAGYHDDKHAALLQKLLADDDLGAAGYAKDDLDAVLKKLEPKATRVKVGDLQPGGMQLLRTCPACGHKF